MDRDYHYMYEYNYPAGSSPDGLISVIMSVYLIILTLVLILALVSYIFHSVGLYTIGKRMGKEYPWLAFIPYARDYFQGELAGPIKLKNKEIKNPGIWNLVIPIISSVLAGIFAAIILFVTGLGAAAQIAGYGGMGIAALLLVLFYTALIVAAVALAAAQMVLTALINKQILEHFTDGNMPIVHAVLSIAVPLYEAFCFFIMRNKDFRPGMEPEITPPPAPIPPMIPGGPGAPVPPPASPMSPTPPMSPVPPVTQAPPDMPEPAEPEAKTEREAAGTPMETPGETAPEPVEKQIPDTDEAEKAE